MQGVEVGVCTHLGKLLVTVHELNIQENKVPDKHDTLGIYITIREVEIT